MSQTPPCQFVKAARTSAPYHLSCPPYQPPKCTLPLLLHLHPVTTCVATRHRSIFVCTCAAILVNLCTAEPLSSDCYLNLLHYSVHYHLLQDLSVSSPAAPYTQQTSHNMSYSLWLLFITASPCLTCPLESTLRRFMYLQRLLLG